METNKTVNLLFFPEQDLYVIVKEINFDENRIIYKKTSTGKEVFNHSFEIKKDWVFASDDAGEVKLQFPFGMLVPNVITTEMYAEDFKELADIIIPSLEELEEGTADAHKSLISKQETQI